MSLPGYIVSAINDENTTIEDMIAIAIERKDPNTLQMLFCSYQNQNINSPIVQDWTPLMYSITKGDLGTTRFC